MSGNKWRFQPGRDDDPDFDNFNDDDGASRGPRRQRPKDGGRKQDRRERLGHRRAAALRNPEAFYEN